MTADNSRDGGGNLGRVAILPDDPSWAALNLGSPAAILSVLVSKSGVFALVDAADAADRTLASGTAAGVDPERGEAKVGLTLRAATGTIEASAEGLASKLGIGPDGGGPVGWWGDLAANGFNNDELGADPLVALAYLDAYIKLVKQMEGDLPNPSEAS